MSSIIHCPRCGARVAVPGATVSETWVRCRVCQAEYRLGDALDYAPPELEILDGPSPGYLAGTAGHAAVGGHHVGHAAGLTPFYPEHKIATGANLAEPSEFALVSEAVEGNSERGWNDVDNAAEAAVMAELGISEDESLEPLTPLQLTSYENGADAGAAALAGRENAGEADLTKVSPADALPDEIFDFEARDAADRGEVPQAEGAVDDDPWSVGTPSASTEKAEDDFDFLNSEHSSSGEATQSGTDDTPVDFDLETGNADSFADPAHPPREVGEKTRQYATAPAAAAIGAIPAFTNRPKRKKSGAIGTLIGVVGGGILAFVISYYGILMWAIKMDPLHLAGYLPEMMVPSSLQTKTRTHAAGNSNNSTGGDESSNSSESGTDGSSGKSPMPDLFADPPATPGENENGKELTDPTTPGDPLATKVGPSRGPADPLSPPANTKTAPGKTPADPLDPASPDTPAETDPNAKNPPVTDPAVTDPTDPFNPNPTTPKPPVPATPDSADPLTPLPDPAIPNPPVTDPAIGDPTDPFNPNPPANPQPKTTPTERPGSFSGGGGTFTQPTQPVVEKFLLLQRNENLTQVDQFREAAITSGQSANDLASAPSDQKRKLTAYRDLVKLGELVAFLPPDTEPSIVARFLTQARFALSALARNPDQLDQLATLTPLWLKAAKRTNNGVLLVGEVKDSAPAGTLHSATITIKTSDMKSESLEILSAVPIPAGPAELLGCIVDKPKSTIPGYAGEDERVLWVSVPPPTITPAAAPADATKSPAVNPSNPLDIPADFPKPDAPKTEEPKLPDVPEPKIDLDNPFGK